jgi:hypothetical protein
LREPYSRLRLLRNALNREGDEFSVISTKALALARSPLSHDGHVPLDRAHLLVSAIATVLYIIITVQV